MYASALWDSCVACLTQMINFIGSSYAAYVALAGMITF